VKRWNASSSAERGFVRGHVGLNICYPLRGACDQLSPVCA